MSGRVKRIPVRPTKEIRKTWISLGMVLVLFLVASLFTEYKPWEFITNMENFWSFIFQDLFPPSMPEPMTILEGVIQTVSMAVVATLMAALCSGILAFLGSKATCPWMPLRKIIRFFASIQRNIPSMIWVFILIMAFGIGNVVGILALLIQSCGFLTRAFIETLDEVGDEKLEIIKAVGGGRMTMIVQVLIPSCMVGMISWVLYGLELNIRSSTLVGAVGGGGIGLIMMGYIKLFRYHSAMATILLIAAIVIFVDMLTNLLRKKVLV